jgi:hypothetical protein
MNTSPFWVNDIKVLFKQNDISQLFPLEIMTFEEKLNAITRLVILMTFLGFSITKQKKILITGIISVLAIIFLYKIKIQPKLNKTINIKEGFSNPELYKLLKKKFTTPTIINPLMNILPNEIQDNPKRNQAAPAYNSAVEKEINEKTKEFVTNNFDDKTNIDERLFKDLGDNIMFDNSMRAWYSTANTTVPNDQKSFAEYCYGDMVSCKEGNEFACSRNSPPHWIN